MAQPPPAAPPPPPAAPPPGPSGGGGPAPFGVGEAIGYGWRAFWKNVGPLLLISLVIIVINAVVSGIGQVSRNLFVLILFSILGWLVALLLRLGFIRAALAVTSGGTPEVGMLFRGEGFGPYFVASIVFGLVSSIGFLLCIIPGIIVWTFWGFYGYVIADGGYEMKPMDALKASVELTEGKRGELFVLFLALIGINILGFLACCVGVIFTAAISEVAMAYTYRSLKGQSVTEYA